MIFPGITSLFRRLRGSTAKVYNVKNNTGDNVEDGLSDGEAV